DEVGAEDDLGHVHRVLGPFRGGDRAHERLVTEGEVGVDHVEVPLGDGQVDRLAQRPSGVVEGGGHVGELGEVAEVLDRGVPPAAVQVAHERAAVGGGEDHMGVADLHAPLRVAGVLGVPGRGGRLDDLAAHPFGETHPGAVDVGAVVGEDPQRLGEVHDLDAHLGQEAVGVLFDGRQPLLVEHLVRGETAGEEGLGLGERGGAGPLACCPAPRSASCRHLRLLSLDLLPPRRPLGGAVSRGRTSDRWGKSWKLWGKPMAATKCSWNRLSVAVSTFSTRAATASISRRAAPERRAMMAPLPAALPAADTLSRSQAGIRPMTMAYFGSMWLPKAPARRISSTRSTPIRSMSRRVPAYSAAFASWIARTSFWVIEISGSSHSR